ncbi:Bug family tripartite tricarboxylate transporter substrate binding protein [Lutibaculum baratangense]|uniref:Putative exported protein n=1 Tax=Lutibaculum baratangense AMV1 TaxID=631454 RepID=V4QYU5_9HYPH|nr:tripartite tricarboxylate transporter substrate binding protein [Lutibaculum baratangense]ESR24892.1 putative exported protein [Lutibaculum baratangense AMV1]
MLKKIVGLTAGLAFALGAAGAANAQYPERAVTIVVPFSAGGNSDVIARIVADHMSGELGQPVVVENRGGGGGTVGASMVAGAEPDGYTLLLATAGTHSVNPGLRDVGYDPIEDFDPISVAVISSVLLVVHPSVEAETAEELIELTSSGEGQFNYASGGIGTVAHVAGELYNEMTGSQLVHVPYQGAGAALNDVVAGRIHVYMNNIPAILTHVRSGALRPLALAADERSNLLPDVPTTGEVGLEGFEMGSWFGIVAPAGTPDEAVTRLHEAMASMKDSEKVKERLEAVGSEVAVSESPEVFGEYMREQLSWWADVLDNPAFRE